MRGRRRNDQEHHHPHQLVSPLSVNSPVLDDSVHSQHVWYSEELRECFYYEQQDDCEEKPRGLCRSRSAPEISLSERIENLRETVGDFGLALFAPLLDFDGANMAMNDCMPKHSCETLQTEPESDQYQTEDDDEDEEEDSWLLVQIAAEPAVDLDNCPRILTLEQMHTLKEYLPMNLRDHQWERCFAIGLHGDSFYSMLERCRPYRCTVVVIRSVTGEILGGFASEKWRIQDEKGHDRHAYYGTGQSFVFGSHPDYSNEENASEEQSIETMLHVYKWTGENDYCQICDYGKRVMCMGGVGDFGWIVSDDFTVGQTGACGTFGNPPLMKPDSFQIADFEIYGLSPDFGFGLLASPATTPSSVRSMF